MENQRKAYRQDNMPKEQIENLNSVSMDWMTIAERDKYSANDVKPGLTGRTQINDKDELEIPVEAKFDGEYVCRMCFAFDCKCFFGIFKAVLNSDGVVEGGTDTLEK